MTRRLDKLYSIHYTVYIIHLYIIHLTYIAIEYTLPRKIHTLYTLSLADMNKWWHAGSINYTVYIIHLYIIQYTPIHYTPIHYIPCVCCYRINNQKYIILCAFCTLVEMAFYFMLDWIKYNCVEHITRLIQKYTKFALVPSETENCNHNQILFDSMWNQSLLFCIFFCMESTIQTLHTCVYTHYVYTKSFVLYGNNTHTLYTHKTSSDDSFRICKFWL